MNRRSFFKGLAAFTGAAAVKVGARILYVSSNRGLDAALKSVRAGDKILLKRGIEFGGKPCSS